MKLLGLFSILTFVLSLNAAPEPSKAPSVSTEVARASELYDLLIYPARLTPNINATLLSESDGIVRNIQAPLGKTVKKGQVVLSIVNTDPVYQYAPMALRAPVAGIVSNVEVTEGSHVTRGQKLVTITDPSQVRIQVEVTASDLPALSPGMSGELIVASEASPVPVKIQGISPFVDPASGTATAELELTNKKTSLPPGLVGRVSFRAKTHQGIQVPEHAVVYRGHDPFIRVVEEGKARFSGVRLGPSRRGFVEVVSGLKAGANVIVRASTYVAEGETVTEQKAESRSE